MVDLKPGQHVYFYRVIESAGGFDVGGVILPLSYVAEVKDGIVVSFDDTQAVLKVSKMFSWDLVAVPRYRIHESYARVSNDISNRLDKPDFRAQFSGSARV